MTTDRLSPDGHPAGHSGAAEPQGVERFAPLPMALGALSLILLLSAVTGLMPVSVAAPVVHAGLRLVNPALAASPLQGPLPVHAMEVLSAIGAIAQFLYVAVQVAALTVKRPRLIVEAPLQLVLPIVISLFVLAIVLGGAGQADGHGSAALGFLVEGAMLALPASLGVYYAFRIRRDNLWFQHVARTTPGRLDGRHKGLLKAFLLGCLVSAWITYRLTH